MSNLAAVSMAMLQVQFAKKRNYLDIFEPFIIEAVKRDINSPVNIPLISSFIKSEFGIEIPQKVVQKIVNKMIIGKYFTQIRYNKKIYPIPTMFQDTSFQYLRVELKRKYAEFITELIKYANEEFGKNWTEQDAIDQLDSFLSQYHIEIIKSHVNKSAMPLSQYKPGPTLTISMFIIKQQEKDTYLFNYLVEIVSGYILSRVLYEEDLDHKIGYLNETKIILDTNLLMPLLGYNGKEEQESCVELLSLLKKYKAQVCCFKHNRDEVDYLLSTAAAELCNGRQSNWVNPCMTNFLKLKYTAEIVLALASSLDDDLSNLGIQILDAPSYNDFNHVIDEQELTEALRERTKREHTIMIDVKSISAVQRLRGDQTSSAIEKCKAVFITSNKNVANCANKFIKKDVGHYRNNIPNCLTDYDLTVKLWLKAPTKFPDLPKKRIIADCYASLRPDEADYSDFLKHLDMLLREGKITQEKVYYYKCITETQLAFLEQRTNTDSKTWKDKEIFVILDRADQILNSENIKIFKEKDQTIKELSGEKNIRELRKRKISSSVSKFIVGFFKILLFFIFLSPALFAIIGNNTDNNNLKIKLIIALEILVAAYYAYDTVYDGLLKIKTRFKSLEITISTMIYKILNWI